MKKKIRRQKVKINPGNRRIKAICTSNREIVSFGTVEMYSRIKTTIFVATEDFDTFFFPKAECSCKDDPVLSYCTSGLT